ncbi:MAG: hypothetical protein AB1742_06760, partial [bacterium]
MAKTICSNRGATASGAASGTAFQRAAVLFAALAFLCSAAAPQETDLRINMILDDGRILIYRGADSGLKPGDRLRVLRDGESVAVLEVADVRTTYTIAVVAEQVIPPAVNDALTRIPPGESVERKVEKAEVSTKQPPAAQKVEKEEKEPEKKEK